MSRDDVVELFADWIRQPEQQALRALARVTLGGHDLACSCPEGARCHGDVWLMLLAEPDDGGAPGWDLAGAAHGGPVCMTGFA